MDCKQARRMVTAFIRGELSNEDTKEFLDHVCTCPECRDELEIYYTIEVGLDQLDNNKGDFNLMAALERTIRNTYQRLHMLFLGQVFVYSLNTLVAVGVILITLLQLRIWFWQG